MRWAGSAAAGIQIRGASGGGVQSGGSLCCMIGTKTYRPRNQAAAREHSYGNPMGSVDREGAGSDAARQRTGELKTAIPKWFRCTCWRRCWKIARASWFPCWRAPGCRPRRCRPKRCARSRRFRSWPTRRRSRICRTATSELLDLAFKAAANFKDEYVSTEHLLLGLMGLKKDAAQQIVERARRLAGYAAEGAGGGARQSDGDRPESRSRSTRRWSAMRAT